LFEEAARERFRQKALLFAPDMRFSPELVNEAVGVLENVFGAKWIDEKADERSRAVPLPLRKHPIGGMIHTAGEVQIAEALELVEYLKMFSESPAFKTVADGLVAHFRSTRLQLAFAYRIGRLVPSMPVLEPPAAGGRLGDIGFSVDDRDYLAECYAPGSRSAALDQVQWLTSQVMEAIQDRDEVYSVGIGLKKLPNAAERKALVRKVRQLVKQIEPVEWPGFGYPPSEIESNELAVISVAKTRVSALGEPAMLALHPHFPDLGEPDQFAAVKQVRASRVKALRSNTLAEPRLCPPGRRIRWLAYLQGGRCSVLFGYRDPLLS
jgi:hypothetical protein